MRRLKCLFLVLLPGVLSLFLPCMLLTNGVNALTISNLRNQYIQYIDFNQYSPSASYTSVALKNNISTPLYSATIQPDQTLRLSSLVIRLANTVNYSKNDKWDLTLYTYTFIDSFRGLNGKTLIPTALCPTFSSASNLIDECNIEYHDTIDSPIDLNHLDITTPSVGTDFAVQNKIHGYYAIKLKGHFTSNGSGNAMNLSAPFLGVYNPTAFELPFQYLIAFSPLKVYTEVPDEDKAAEELNEMNQKDDQDRSDIESQSSNIDSSGESSQQSAQNTGTTLLAAFSSFVTAITSASPSNCNIDMDLGNLDLGIVNFCTLSPPPEFQVLGSIFLILFCVPLSIATARKVISLFRSFQG